MDAFRNTVHLLCVLPIFLLWCCACTEAVEYNMIYLNSHKYCGHDKSFPVNKNLMYKIASDVSPGTETTSYMDCEVTFHSEDVDGRLCLLQDGLPTQVKDSNLNLVASDGVGNPEDDKIFDLTQVADNYLPGQWPNMEQCTKTRFLHINLQRKDISRPADIHKVNVHLKVMDIKSHDRRAYLDGSFCGRDYLLHESSINIYNRPKPIKVERRGENGANVPETPQIAETDCGMNVKKDPQTKNSSICFVYIPEGTPDCSSWWKLYVTSRKYSREPQDVMYSLECSDVRASKMHAWCAPASMHYVMVVHERDITETGTSHERPGMYRLVLRDFPGGNTNELLRTVERLLPHTGGKNDLSFSVWWLAAAVAGGVILFVVVALVFRSRCRSKSNGRRSRRTSDVEEKSLPDEENMNGNAETVSLNSS